MKQFETHFFKIILVLVTLLGLVLRLHQYDRLPPFGETKDEFMYPWAGMTWMQTGTPMSWSYFPSYPKGTDVKLWGETFRLVSPWVEKPPLYSLLTGQVMLLSGAQTLSDVRFTTLRLIPIFLSLITIIVLGLTVRQVTNEAVALISSLLYAVTPTIVMANRLSLTENLLTPLTLLTLYIYVKPAQGKFSLFKPFILGLGCALTLLTKNVSIALPISLIILMCGKREWKPALIVALISIIGIIIHPLMGWYYDWGLFTAVLEDYRQAFILGFPETIASIFLYPVIGHKEKIFLDGAMLSGYILLLAAPFWLRVRHYGDRILPLLSFPFAYLGLMCLMVGGKSWFGWHLFPVYPFLSFVLSVALYELFTAPEFLRFMFFFMTLAASSIRFLLLTTPSLNIGWQTLLGAILVGTGIVWPLERYKVRVRQTVLFILFALFIFTSIYTVFHLSSIYQVRPQPLF